MDNFKNTLWSWHLTLLL